MNNYFELSETEIVLLDMESMVTFEDMEVFCVDGEVYEHNGNEWISDWNVYVFYKAGETDSSQYLYYDQSAPDVAIENFCRYMSARSRRKEAA